MTAPLSTGSVVIAGAAHDAVGFLAVRDMRPRFAPHGGSRAYGPLIRPQSLRLGAVATDENQLHAIVLSAIMQARASA